jgi:hypothetical protein
MPQLLVQLEALPQLSQPELPLMEEVSPPESRDMAAKVDIMRLAVPLHTGQVAFAPDSLRRCNSSNL